MLSSMIAAKLLRKKLAVFIKEDYFFDNIYFQRLLFKFIAKYSDIVFCHTKKQKEALLRYNKSLNVTIQYELIYGSDGPIAEKPKETEAGIKLGIIGKIYELKGQMVFVKALEEVSKLGIKIQGYVYGNCRRYSNNWNYLVEIKNYIKSRNISNIYVMGPAILTNEIYGNLEVVVIASKSESCPLVYLEAMKYGKVVISTKVGIMEDLGRDGENLIFFQIGDFHDLALKIKMLHNHPEIKEKIVQNGFKLFSEKFDKVKLIDKFIKEIMGVADENRN